MYCKLFASLYQGTLRGRSNEILVFTNLLAHATKEGTVDKHFRAIAEETGLSIDEVKAAIIVLESPDEESRSPEAHGARLLRIDEHRVWGWQIVNYAKYRAIRSEDDRAEQNRLAQARWREKHKQSKPPSAEGNTDKPKDREKQMDREKEKKDEEGLTPVVTAAPNPPSPPVLPKKAKRTIAMAEGEWLSHLENDPTYRGIDVRRELGKMQQWCILKKKPASQQRFLSWLNRIDKPMGDAPPIEAPEQPFWQPPEASEPIDLMAMLLANRAKTAAREAALATPHDEEESRTWTSV